MVRLRRGGVLRRVWSIESPRWVVIVEGRKNGGVRKERGIGGALGWGRRVVEIGWGERVWIKEAEKGRGDRRLVSGPWMEEGEAGRVMEDAAGGGGWEGEAGGGRRGDRWGNGGGWLNGGGERGNG